jgi:NitT/TauT family transport system substrate-binding protein
LAAVALSVGLAAMAGRALPQGLRKITVTQTSAEGVGFSAIYIARYNHYFEEEGFDVKVAITGGGGPEVAALISGQVEFTAAGPPNQLALYQQGQKTLSVISFFDLLTANLVINKKIYEAKRLGTLPIEQRIKVLKGLKISVTRLGSLTDMVARSYVRRAGLDPETDAKIIATTSGAPQLAALEHNQVDAAVVTSPMAETIVTRGAGTMLINNTNGDDPVYAPPFTAQAILVRPDWARQNAGLVKGFVRAMLRADRWAHDHSAEEGAKVVQSFLPHLDLKIVTEQYAQVKHGFPATGCLSQKGVESVIKLFELAGQLSQPIRWTDIATNEYLPHSCPS